MKKMLYIIYQITNILNNKIYIGCHKTENINDKYMGSGINLIKDIREFGVNNFKKDVLFIFDNQVDMLSKESEIVNSEFIQRDNTYNIARGGAFLCGELCKGTTVVIDAYGDMFRIRLDDDRYLSGELKPISCGYVSVKDKNGKTSRVKIDDESYLSGDLVPIWSGRSHKEESKNKIRGDRNGFYGKTHTDETKLIISNINKEHIGEKNSFYGKHHSEETKKKLSEISKELWSQGRIGFTGQKHTEETKKLLSTIISENQKGSGNSQYGTCWIYSYELQINKKIKKEEIDIWIQNGWTKGMKKDFFKRN